jgi:hypothetical protein
VGGLRYLADEEGGATQRHECRRGSRPSHSQAHSPAPILEPRHVLLVLQHTIAVAGGDGLTIFDCRCEAAARRHSHQRQTIDAVESQEVSWWRLRSWWRMCCWWVGAAGSNTYHIVDCGCFCDCFFFCCPSSCYDGGLRSRSQRNFVIVVR